MISRVSGLLMLPSETQSRGRVQQMRQHRSLDEHDRPKGDTLMQRQDQDAVEDTEEARNLDGPKSDGTYIVEFRTAAGEVLAISMPRTG
jgi:hypothetical protein